MSAIKSVVIVGGTGKVAIELTRLLLARKPIPPQITSIVRSTTSPSFKSLEELPNYTSDIVKAVPLSLESSTVQELADVLREAKADVVVFAAGAGGKGGEGGMTVAERTKKVDYEGVVKIYDAIEQVQSQGLDPRLITISGVDVRDENIIPEHYTDADKAVSARIRTAIGTWFHCKYLADKDLMGRTKFKWTILRPGGLVDKPAMGLVECGKTHITEPVSRSDVAHALELLIDRPDAAGLALDIVGGQSPIEEAVDKAINDRVTGWIG